MSEFYIGVMSGTSLDAIDVVLCEISDVQCKLICSHEFAFDKKLKSEILHTLSNNITLRDIGILDHKLGKLFAKSVNAFIKSKKLNPKNIKAIGLHGQTLWHEPNTSHPFSMQLGDANIVNIQTGIDVVADFRRKDIALGGEGAPFTPAYHKFIFDNLEKKAVVLNIGGMANITILGEKLTGYDTGCGNVLMDLWASEHLHKPYDKNGVWAKKGQINELLLQEMLKEPYFAKKLPKSTGRELFNKHWLLKHLCKFPILKPEDVQATLLELTTISIKNEILKTDAEMVIVCGGGTRNKCLIKRLKEELEGIEVIVSDQLGIKSDFLEAMAFAWLAYKRVHKEVVELSGVTGASRDVILGALYE